MTLQRTLTKCDLRFKLWEKLQSGIWASACLLGVAVLLMQANGQAADKFKPFKLKTVGGAATTLQDVAGKATLISFFFPTCVYCNAEFPAIQ